jgi:predicted dehydrogenase
MAMPLLARGIPLLVEKPIAGSMADGEALVEAVIETGVPILVGHHRRHSPAIQAAQRCIAQGTLGRLVAVQVATLFHKPPDYFDVTWRRGPAGGPILINLIHDIDTLRALAGEIVQARSITSSRIRGFPVEDTAAVLVQFAGGALGTLLLSDTTTSPRSWEHTSGENPVFPHEPNQDCIFLSGTLGSLAIPSMRLWTQGGQPSWLRPLTSGQLGFETGDPLTRQLDHFCDVIEHQAIPLVTAADALRTLEITLQIRE